MMGPFYGWFISLGYCYLSDFSFSQDMDTDKELSLMERVVFDIRKKLDNEGNALFNKGTMRSCWLPALSFTFRLCR